MQSGAANGKSQRVSRLVSRRRKHILVAEPRLCSAWRAFSRVRPVRKANRRCRGGPGACSGRSWLGICLLTVVFGPNAYPSAEGLISGDRNPDIHAAEPTAGAWAYCYIRAVISRAPSVYSRHSPLVPDAAIIGNVATMRLDGGMAVTFPGRPRRRHA